jgi:hypothetical protein
MPHETGMSTTRLCTTRVRAQCKVRLSLVCLEDSSSLPHSLLWAPLSSDATSSNMSFLTMFPNLQRLGTQLCVPTHSVHTLCTLHCTCFLLALLSLCTVCPLTAETKCYLPSYPQYLRTYSAQQVVGKGIDKKPLSLLLLVLLLLGNVP